MAHCLVHPKLFRSGLWSGRNLVSDRSTVRCPPCRERTSTASGRCAHSRFTVSGMLSPMAQSTPTTSMETISVAVRPDLRPDFPLVDLVVRTSGPFLPTGERNVLRRLRGRRDECGTHSIPQDPPDNSRFYTDRLHMHNHCFDNVIKAAGQHSTLITKRNF